MPIVNLTNTPNYLSTISGKKFETYRFYLKCICDFLISEYNNLPEFISYCVSSTSRVSRLLNLDSDEINKKLRIAWNTEYLLSIDHGDPEITRINNQWTPIQAYYAVYSGLDALSYGINGVHTSSHVKALRECSTFFIGLGVSPWDKAYTGPRGRNKNDQIPLNFPATIIIPHNLQRFGVTPIDMIAKFLKVEHSHRVDDKWKSKRESGCYKYLYDPKPTTLLHFLYRLRVKSNYEEVDTFVTDAPESIIIEFAQSLRVVTSWTLALIEIVLIRRFSKECILPLIESYASLNNDSEILLQRLAIYNSLC